MTTRCGRTRRRNTTKTPRCGLCGRTDNLTKTECCSQWVYDDEDQFALFSYARSGCHRNHDRYTLCALHHAEDHPGDWKTCPQCRRGIETEMYVYYGTNEYNFEKLENPPAYESARCTNCNAIIVSSEGGYSQSSKGCFCAQFSDISWASVLGGG